MAARLQRQFEVGMLYEDIEKSPYIQLFNSGTTARRLWRAVGTLRVIDSEFRILKTGSTRKEQLIAIHGNRFVAHLVFQTLKGSDGGLTEPGTVGSQIRELTKQMLDRTIQITAEQHAGAYPASLFKNASKCRLLAKAALSEQPPENPVQQQLIGL